ncbi:MAG TPA: glycosyltransferase family 4 protein [Candidatus Saccharimonadales bacterium]|nr:glycosyltransferase family 4 protein [Candidatus Saccharimonadales bacterium]
MKIAFIGQKGIPAQNGGVDRHVENLALFLAKKGENIIVYNRRGYLPEKINKWEGVTLVHLPYINRKNLAAITHSFLATIDAMRRKVDVMHYHGIGPCLLAWIPRVFTPKIKVIATLHSFDYGNEKWGRFAKFMLKRGEKSMSRYAQEVIVLTDLMHDYLLQKYNRESIVIPNGAYIENNKEAKFLVRFGLEPKKYLVSVSRIIKLKGIQYLISALKELPTYDIKLAIVGDGEYREELEKMAGNDPRIVFTGNQSGEILNQLYSQAKYFIQSSEMEGLSISLLEAMAHGLPCIVSDIPANQEATGETALYFRQKDKDDLRNKLIYAFEHEDKMAELGVKAKERAISLFNWEKISEATLKIYRK